MLGQEGAPGLPVDVVRVAHPVRGVAHVVGGAEDGVDGATRHRLGRETHVDGRRPGALDVVADGGPGARTQHQHDRAEAGGERVGGHEVDDGLAVRADRSQWLHASVALGPAGSQDDERGARPARPVAHAFQRKTALAQVIPPPKPVSRRLSPSWMRPSPMASYSASGMEADEVLP